MQTDKIFEAFKQDFQNIEEYSEYESEIWIPDNISKKELEIITQFFIKKLKSYSWGKSKFKPLAKVLIELLSGRKEHSVLIEIAEYFSDDNLEEMDVLFELAYAYGELSESEKSKKFYQKIWDKEQSSSAVANNLGVIYENEDDWDTAVELFEKAIELDLENQIASNNLKRVKAKISDEIKNIKKWEQDQAQALEDIALEDFYIHERLFFLINKEDSNKYIAASYSELCGILKAGPEKVQELIKKFLEKNYIYKIKDHNIDTRSNVYRLNHAVRDFILKKRKRIEINKTYSEIGEKINIDSIENLGLDDRLLAIIDSKIKDRELKKILKRDLKENVFALLTQSHKTALVLSGSIIESLIFNKIIEFGIIKHFPNKDAKKNKKVEKMDLSELLYVADKNNIVEVQLYHFSQALKQYRNFIHPAVEIRKGRFKRITKDDADLAWRITKKIIKEI